MLILHHLQISQSERITFLLEELSLPYKLQLHTRSPLLAPESLSLPGNTLGKSPFLEDTDRGVSLAESGAITDYILSVYGNGKLVLKPGEDGYADYLYWKDFANSTMQPAMITAMFLENSDVSSDHMIRGFAQQRLEAALQAMDDRLGKAKWLAGEKFTAADTMSVYAVSTQRFFGPRIGLERYANLVRWLGDCSAREGYRKAMEKADPEMRWLVTKEAPAKTLMEVGGVESDIWKRK